MPFYDSRRNESHRSVTYVPQAYFFRRGLLLALLPPSMPVWRSFSPFIVPAAVTATTTLIATTTFRSTTPRFTCFDSPILFLRNYSMGVIAPGMGSTTPKGAIGDIPINTVIHIHLFTLPPMFGKQIDWSVAL